MAAPSYRGPQLWRPLATCMAGMNRAIHVGSGWKIQKKEENTQTIKYNWEKQTTQNTAKQNYSGSVASCDTRPGNEVGLFYTVFRKNTHSHFLSYLQELFVDLNKNCGQ